MMITKIESSTECVRLKSGAPMMTICVMDSEAHTSSPIHFPSFPALFEHFIWSWWVWLGLERGGLAGHIKRREENPGSILHREIIPKPVVLGPRALHAMILLSEEIAKPVPYLSCFSRHNSK